MPDKMPFKVSALVLSWLIKSLLTGPVGTMAQGSSIHWGSKEPTERCATFGQFALNFTPCTQGIMIFLKTQWKQAIVWLSVFEDRFSQEHHLILSPPIKHKIPKIDPSFLQSSYDSHGWSIH
jgi:hypothetical protein